MQNVFGNFRYAFRQFRLAPIFTVTAILTLALALAVAAGALTIASLLCRNHSDSSRLSHFSDTGAALRMIAQSKATD